MRPQIRIRYILLFFVTVGFLNLQQPNAWAKPDCKNAIQYNPTDKKLTFAGFGLSIGGSIEGNKSVQVATDLTQIFDMYQAQVCQLVHDNKATPQDIQNALDASARLAELMVISSKDKPSDDDLKTIIESVPKAQAVKSKLQTTQTNTTKLSTINLVADLNAANPEFVEYMARFKASSPTCPTDSLSDQSKTNIAKSLGDAVLSLTGPLNINPDLLRTYVFMLCTDGRFHVPLGLTTVGRNQVNSQAVVTMSPGYGFVGVTYETGMEQMGIIPKSGSVTFIMGNDPSDLSSQQDARRILIGPNDIRSSTASWVIAKPLMNGTSVIGVLTVSSDQLGVLSDSNDRLQQEKMLRDIYYGSSNKNTFDQLGLTISSLLLKR